MARAWRMLLGSLMVLSACSSETIDTPTEARAPDEARPATTIAAPPTTLAHRLDTSVTSAPAGALSLRMEDYEFVPSELATKEGKVTIFLANTDDGVLSDGGRPDDEIHDFYIASEDGFPLAKSPRLDPGTTGAFTIEGMRPGKYPFVCTLHAATQMRGTIEVTA